MIFAIRCEERNDVRALAKVKAELPRAGLRIDRTRQITVRRNGGLWQYTVPVYELVEA